MLGKNSEAMGAVTRDSKNVTYLSIFAGNLVKRLKEPTEGSVKRVNKNGDTVHEFQYSGWAGRVVRVFIQNPPAERPNLGQSLCVVLEDDEGVRGQIQTPLLGNYSSDMINKLCAVDLKYEITVVPYDFEAEGKRRTGITIEQNGMKIARPLTKETAPDMPQWKKVEFNGQTLWDKRDSFRYLLTMLRKKVKRDGPMILDVPAEWTLDGVAMSSNEAPIDSNGLPTSNQVQRPAAQPPAQSTPPPQNIPPAPPLGAQPAGIPPAQSYTPVPQPPGMEPPAGMSYEEEQEDDLPF